MRFLATFLCLGLGATGALANPGHRGSVSTIRAKPTLWRKQAIEDPGGKGLKLFFDQLSCLGKGRRVARVAHYGDSIIAGDRVTSGVRQVLQGRFGDAGHGYLLAKRPTRWYHRQGVKLRPSRWWKRATLIANWLKTKRYGYGGGVVMSYVPGAKIRYTLRKEGQVGGRWSRIYIYYDRHPRGGWARIRLAGKEVSRFSTRGKQGTAGVHLVKWSDTGARFKLEMGGNGRVRLFGLALEREGPGVVWDGLGLTGTRYHTIMRIGRRHWQRQLRQRGVGLVVFQFGANISDLRHLPRPWYRKAIRTVLTRLSPLRKTLSCLVVGPVDRGYHWKRGRPSRRIVKQIAAVQRKLALAHGCAFWDTRLAMGGKGAARRWYRARPPLIWNDLTHLRPAGAHLLGKLLGNALLGAYAGYRRTQRQPACSGRTPPSRRATSPSGARK